MKIAPRSRLASQLIELIVSIAIIAILIGLLLSAVQVFEGAEQQRLALVARTIPSACNWLARVPAQIAFTPGTSHGRENGGPYPLLNWHPRVLLLSSSTRFGPPSRPPCAGSRFHPAPPHIYRSTIFPIYIALPMRRRHHWCDPTVNGWRLRTYWVLPESNAFRK